MHPRMAHLVRRGVQHLVRRQQDIDPMPGESGESDGMAGYNFDLTTSQMLSVTITSFAGLLALYLVSCHCPMSAQAKTKC